MAPSVVQYIRAGIVEWLNNTSASLGGFTALDFTLRATTLPCSPLTPRCVGSICKHEKHNSCNELHHPHSSKYRTHFILLQRILMGASPNRFIADVLVDRT